MRPDRAGFAGVDNSKFYDIYTHCQMGEEGILRIAHSSQVLLLQIGEDFTGEGACSALIDEADLMNRDFSRCTFAWGPT